MDNRSFDVMRNRMTNGKYFSREAAKARIARLLDELEITQEQADALNALAEQYGGGATVEERLAAVEAAALEHDAALMELAEMLTAGGEA